MLIAGSAVAAGGMVWLSRIAGAAPTPAGCSGQCWSSEPAWARCSC